MSDAVAMSFKARMNLLPKTDVILDQIAQSEIQRGYWKRYQDEFPPAKGVSFDEALAAVRKLILGGR